jgi:transposase
VIEQEHHKKAFEFYYGLGEGRSYRQVSEEFNVSLGAVKAWGRNFGWKRRIGERDGEVARTLAERSQEDMVERMARNRKIVKMGLMQVAKAVAEGKVKVTLADLDRLVRLEEFLREEAPEQPMQVIIQWSEVDKDGNVVTRREYPDGTSADVED